MFILANRNIVLRDKAGAEMLVARGFIGDIPDRFCDSGYFRALIADGKITVPATRKDKEIEAAAEESGAARKSAARRAKAAAEAE